LLIALADGSLLYVEFQSTHDQHIAYRMMEYGTLIKRRYRRPLRQVVVFVGRARALRTTLPRMDRPFVLRCWTSGILRQKS